MEEQKKQDVASHSLESEFVTYEQALALKELGFDEECMADCIGFAYDFKDGKYITSHEQIFYPKDSINPEDIAEELDRHCVHVCGIPLKQQVFRWFRERYEFLIIIRDIEIIASDKSGYRWKWVIFKLTDDIYIAEDKSILGSLTYEEAENACIDKLLEIAKQQDNGK